MEYYPLRSTILVTKIKFRDPSMDVFSVRTGIAVFRAYPKSQKCMLESYNRAIV